MRLLKSVMITLFFLGFGPAVIGAEPQSQDQSKARPRSVKCEPTIHAWVEVDESTIQSRAPIKSENKKRVRMNLIDSLPYRGDAVLCNYSTPRRDVSLSYSIRCMQARKERGYPHTYQCQ